MLFCLTMLLGVVTTINNGGFTSIRTKQFKGRVPGFKVKPIDTTGAGDAFVGGFLYSLAFDPNFYQDEKRLREALYFANACGAITVTDHGAIPSLPTKQAVDQLLAQTPPA